VALVRKEVPKAEDKVPGLPNLKAIADPGRLAAKIEVHGPTDLEVKAVEAIAVKADVRTLAEAVAVPSTDPSISSSKN
jgi:hypothetical protein